MQSALLAIRIEEDNSALWTGRLLAIGAVLALVLIPVMVIRARRRSQRPEASAHFFDGIQGIRPDQIARPGDVRLVYTTYSGSLVYVDQATYDLVLPADEAQTVLKRMFRHNLTSGMFAYGALLIPILSCLTYWSQKRKIRAQAR